MATRQLPPRETPAGGGLFWGGLSSTSAKHSLHKGIACGQGCLLCSFRHNYDRHLQGGPLSSLILEKLMSIRAQHHMSGVTLKMMQVMVTALTLSESSLSNAQHLSKETL